MEAKGKVVPGLASRHGHRAYLTEVARKAVVVDKAEEARLLEGQKKYVNKKTSGRWFHPGTKAAQKICWKKKGKRNTK